MDIEKVKEILASLRRTAENGQDYARSAMDDEPGQRSQNNNFRYILQDLNDLEKELFGEEEG